MFKNIIDFEDWGIIDLKVSLHQTNNASPDMISFQFKVEKGTKKNQPHRFLISTKSI